ncbi:MAG: pentapeptide repeat-containing protein [Thermodesulfobacteriota bacterium]
MGNPNHLHILRQGVAAWNKWREQNPKIKPDLSGAQCSRDDIYNLDLSHANLSDANLSRAKISRVTLSHANLRGANLHDVTYREGNLFGADLRNADLSSANLCGTDFRKAKLSKAKLDYTLLFDADLSEANLYEASMKAADLSRTQLQEASLREADLSRATIATSNLRGANLSRAIFENATLYQADLTDALLEGATFKDARFKEVIWDNANLSGIFITFEQLTQIPQSLKDKYLKSFLVLSKGLPEETAPIRREIEFPPEYLAAGKAILCHFSDVLRRKYPDRRAKVRIEQDGFKVIMAIYPIEGEPEFFEKALDEYGLVVTGRMLPEEYSDDRLLVMDLRNQLRIANVQLECQREMLNDKNAQIDRLFSMVHDGIRAKAPHTIVNNITVSASSNACARALATVEISSELTAISGYLEDLKIKLPRMATQIQRLEKDMEGIKEDPSPEQVEGFRKKLKRWVDGLQEADKGIEAVKRLGGHLISLGKLVGPLLF